MKKKLLLVAGLMATMCASAQDALRYKDASLPVAERVEDLMRRIDRKSVV